ncbi:BglG family transcription antiterminator LicT [Aerococcus sanguinicola]|uniref:PRD domain-containing protein n=1 Tax=Aerococcus sanguinicola TaxID=119206 RepID=A0A2I1MQB0_9LACT|nr:MULTISPECIES: PRD domain-containing protein [Aerococcus]MDK7050075.1 PRD domain-containing protein [Aerococcus sanguinicola]OFT93392.1 transcription antiterminator BglG [Aerococcus sp. HMSC23C02]PKZ22323.1 PRD domain-containing protein [Aerococcus sanguinicola]
MEVKKIFNNNVVLSMNEKDEEIIAMGKGIGFNKKVGDPIDLEKVEKVFVVDSNKKSDYEIYHKIDPVIVEIATDIIKYAQGVLGSRLNNNIYLTLPDHLSFAIERIQKGLEVSSPLYWEVKNFYTVEFMIGEKALDLIKNRIGIDLPEHEAAAIALHIINAKVDSQSMNQTIEVIEMVQDILDIVSYFYGIQLDNSSFHYSRFVTHLRYLVIRLYDHQTVGNNTDSDDFLYEQMVKKYPRVRACVEKVAAYIEQQLDVTIGQEERLYLMIHIQRVISQLENKK